MTSERDYVLEVLKERLYFLWLPFFNEVEEGHDLKAEATKTPAETSAEEWAKLYARWREEQDQLLAAISERQQLGLVTFEDDSDRHTFIDELWVELQTRYAKQQIDGLSDAKKTEIVRTLRKDLFLHRGFKLLDGEKEGP